MHIHLSGHMWLHGYTNYCIIYEFFYWDGKQSIPSREMLVCPGLQGWLHANLVHAHRLELSWMKMACKYIRDRSFWRQTKSWIFFCFLANPHEMSPKRTRNEHTWNETRWHLKQRKCIVVRGLQDQIPWSCVENEPWRIQEEPCYNSDRATFMMTISSFWSLNAIQQCLVAWCLWFVEAIFGAFPNHQNVAIMPPVLHFNLVYSGCILDVYGMYMSNPTSQFLSDKTSHRLFIKVPASQDLTWQHRVHGKACCRCFWKTITTHPRFGSLELKVSQDDMEFFKKCHPLLQRRCLMSFMRSHNSSSDK